MNPVILDGKATSAKIKEDLKIRVQKLVDAGHPKPVLATILVGNDPASETYVKMKGKATEAVSMESRRIELPEATTTEELLKVIDELNADDRVRGILLQHPVPSQVDERAAFDRIAIEKDVDGVTTQGYGRMAMGLPAYGSCTPQGIITLLDEYGVQIEGKHAVVVGRSPILGKPMAAMLLERNATVTICHSRTKDLPSIVKQGDIVVAAVGKPEFIKADWVKEGVVLVDAGYNPGNVGDADYKGIFPKSSFITPVPGGVGPMTITTLIAQTVESAEKFFG